MSQISIERGEEGERKFNFSQLVECAEGQRAVRHCEEEGMVFPIEREFEILESWGFISLMELEELIRIVRS